MTAQKSAQAVWEVLGNDLLQCMRKKHKQRDYIIAICRAMDMSVIETQIALTLNGMDVLNPKKPRDWAIMECINWEYGVHKTNGILEELKFESLKVRCDI